MIKLKIKKIKKERNLKKKKRSKGVIYINVIVEKEKKYPV